MGYKVRRRSLGYMQAKVSGYAWSAKIYTSSSTWVNQLYREPDGSGVSTGSVRACVDIRYYPDPCATQYFHR
jgi:hypothetical protein